MSRGHLKQGGVAMAYRNGKFLKEAAPVAVLLMVAAGLAGCSKSGSSSARQQASAVTCPGDNGGLSLAPGFCASVFADNIGHARHLAVAPDGTVYANTWSGRYYDNAAPPKGGFVVAMKDTNGDGKADAIERFGATPDKGGAGGTGIALYNNAVYVEESGKIVRYPLAPGSAVPSGTGQVVLSGMPLTGDHPMHPFVIDPHGQIYVDMGSATNDCDIHNRMPHTPGHVPCAEKLTRAGIWRYDANKTGQLFSAKERYASGIRNGEGLAFDAAGRLFSTQHGRDQLGQNWPELYTSEQGANLPAEELMLIKQGADYGWPECYYDPQQKKLVLGPEYGGDGGKKIGVCANRTPPVAAFPAHWAPNGLAIYKGNGFPPGYRGGAFIAFHGSWNRAPKPQGGYNIVFQPLANGKASGDNVVFADGFAGGNKDPGKAAYRPSGIAEGPDGALYVADDVHGRIWRITYNGKGDDKVAPAPAPTATPPAPVATASPPEGTHPDAGRTPQALPTPPGATAEEVALGERIFHGEVDNGTCAGCHGTDAGGTTVGPPLNRGTWIWSNGSLAALTETIRNGVPHPKRYSGAMPPMGGTPLSDRDLHAVAAYVWAVGHAGK